MAVKNAAASAAAAAATDNKQEDEIDFCKIHFPMMEQSIVHAITVPIESLESTAEIHRKYSAFNGKPLPAAAAASNPLRAVLQEYGCAIIPNVLSQDEIKKAFNLFADDLRGIVVPSKSDPALLAKFAGDDPNTNIVSNWPIEKVGLGHKFCSHFGLTQQRLAWFARLNENVRKVFANQLGTNDLITGTDAIFYSYANDREMMTQPSLPDAQRTTNFWAHADANHSKFPYVNGAIPDGRGICQSILSISDCSAPDAQHTVVQIRSHKEPYAALMKARDWTGSGHYCAVHSQDAMKQFVREARRVPVPAGGLFIWSSQLLHQGGWAAKRLAVPVSMEPKWRRTQEVLVGKVAAVEHGVPTSHWASLGIVHSNFEIDQEFTIRHDRYNRDSPPLITVRGRANDGITERMKEMPFWVEQEKAYWAARATDGGRPTLSLMENAVLGFRQILLPVRLGGLVTSNVLPSCVMDVL